MSTKRTSKKNDMKTELMIADDMTLSQLGDTLVKSGYFSDTRQAGQAVVKILAGRELGHGPIASMTGINIIQNKVAISANMLAATIKATRTRKSGRYNYRVLELSNEKCAIQFSEDGESCGPPSVFTLEDAASAGLINSAN